MLVFKRNNLALNLCRLFMASGATTSIVAEEEASERLEVSVC